MIAASLDTDRCGLHVRRDGATIRFTYTTGVFVLERA
jgi:hypothetical protein